MNVSAKAETDANLERSTRASSAFLKPVACMANEEISIEGTPFSWVHAYPEWQLGPFLGCGKQGLASWGSFWRNV